MDCKTVLVVGSGTMGLGIAHVSALGGYDTILNDVSEEQLRRAVDTIRGNMAKGVERGRVTPDAAAAAIARLRTDTSLGGAARVADFAIEAVPEDPALKARIFSQLDAHAPPHAVLATNTSGLSITEIAASTKRPQRVIGMHFFNPVHLMKLVEIIRGRDTSEETVLATEAVSLRMGKETVRVNESPGFVTSRMNALIGNEAFRMLEAGVASARDIDKALKLGLNHPMGPFEMVDLVGLDVRLSILRYLHRTLGDLYKPSPMLEKLVAEGRLGRKTGRGVYDYSDPRP
jgi:3-hydroxybutyryl-CoA dehydrogenase